MPPALKRLAAPLLALLVAAPLAAQEANRNAPFGLPGPARPHGRPTRPDALPGGTGLAPLPPSALGGPP